MDTVIIVIHLMVIVALIAVVLLQRSEGGALGIGGGNSFMSARGQGNLLTKTTAVLAAAFFATSIALTVLARMSSTPGSVLDTVPTAPVAPAAQTNTDANTPTTTPSTDQGGSILDRLNNAPGATTPATGDSTTVPAPAGSGAAPADSAPANP